MPVSAPPLNFRSGSLTASGTSGGASDALGSSVTLSPLLGSPIVLAVVTGTFSATLQFEGLPPSGGWVSVLGMPVTGGLLASAISVPANYLVNAVGMHALRVRCSSFASGQADVTLATAPAVGLLQGASDANGRAVVNLNVSAGLGDGLTNSPTALVDSAGVGRTLAVVPYAVSGTSTYDRPRTANVFKPQALGAATAETTLWTPTSGKKFRLMGFLLTPGGAATLTFKDNTGGSTIAAARGSTDVPILWQPPSTNGILSAAANNVLTVTRGASVTLDGTVWGTEE